MNGRPIWTPEKEEKFLEVLATGASVARAAAEIGAARSTVFGWKKDNPKFAERWDNAVETGTDLMEDEALRLFLENGSAQKCDHRSAGRNWRHDRAARGSSAVSFDTIDEARCE